MTIAGLELLRGLEETHAFDPVPLPSDRTANYVRFEELARLPCESRLSEAIVNAQRTAIIGPVGSGKSSLIEYVVTGIETAAPLWVSAAHEGDRTLRDPVEFARHMIRQIVRWAADVDSMTDDERHAALVQSGSTHARRTRRVTQTLGVKLAAMWIEPSWTREIQETLADPEVERIGAEIVGSLDRLVELVHGLDRLPVVIIDDSDRWLNTEGSDRDGLLEGFFRGTCRMLAERNWSIVLAIHPEYCSAPGFRAALAEGFVNNRIDMPSLAGPGAIRLLFDERVLAGARDAVELRALELGLPVSLAGVTADSATVFEDSFDELLFEWYRQTGGNVRAMLTVADQTLRETILRGEPRISNDALRETMLALAYRA